MANLWQPVFVLPEPSISLHWGIALCIHYMHETCCSHTLC
jgi:hypothetical protein